MDLKHKSSQTLFSYWDSVRDGRSTPRRFEIEPARIATILPSTFILERIDAETYRFRLAGTSVCDIFGVELRGANFLDGWTTLDRLSLIRHLAALTKHGAIEAIHLEAAPPGRASTPFEALLLPLRHTGETIDRILGALNPLHAPHWLGELPITSKRIISHELGWPSGAPINFADTVVRDAVPVFMPPEHTRIVRSERRQFRVFEGGLSRGEIEEN
ncbi:MAG TPA: PAS domain-containing protein [Hyphomicrobium sp.]|nr:PAS domain-containing protein [Hyphomicrobium sp.]